MESREWLDRIESIVSPLLTEQGLSLVDLAWRPHGRRWMLRFSVDKPGGVGIGDCERFSQEAGDLLDASGLISEGYDLEVSSPGLTRELRTEREWRWAQGKSIRCWLAEAQGGRTELTGRLAEVTDSHVRLLEDDGRVTELPRRSVTKARLELEFPGRK